MRIIIILLLTFGMNAQKTPKWMDEFAQMSEKNKAQHYWVSCIGTIGFSFGYYKLFKEKRQGLSCWLGGATMLALGYAKEEIYDGYFKKGVKSGGDKFMNLMGVISGEMGGRVLINEYEKRYCIDYYDSQLTYKK